METTDLLSFSPAPVVIEPSRADVENGDCNTENQEPPRQAILSERNGVYYLETFTPGNSVNGKKICPGSSVALKDGDAVQLGAATPLKFSFSAFAGSAKSNVTSLQKSVHFNDRSPKVFELTPDATKSSEMKLIKGRKQTPMSGAYARTEQSPGKYPSVRRERPLTTHTSSIEKPNHGIRIGARNTTPKMSADTKRPMSAVIKRSNTLEDVSKIPGSEPRQMLKKGLSGSVGRKPLVCPGPGSAAKSTVKKVETPTMPSRNKILGVTPMADVPKKNAFPRFGDGAVKSASKSETRVQFALNNRRQLTSHSAVKPSTVRPSHLGIDNFAPGSPVDMSLANVSEWVDQAKSADHTTDDLLALDSSQMDELNKRLSLSSHNNSAVIQPSGASPKNSARRMSKRSSFPVSNEPKNKPTTPLADANTFEPPVNVTHIASGRKSKQSTVVIDNADEKVDVVLSEMTTPDANRRKSRRSVVKSTSRTLAQVSSNASEDVHDEAAILETVTPLVSGRKSRRSTVESTSLTPGPSAGSKSADRRKSRRSVKPVEEAEETAIISAEVEEPATSSVEEVEEPATSSVEEVEEPATNSVEEVEEPTTSSVEEAEELPTNSVEDVQPEPMEQTPEVIEVAVNPSPLKSRKSRVKSENVTNSPMPFAEHPLISPTFAPSTKRRKGAAVTRQEPATNITSPVSILRQSSEDNAQPSTSTCEEAPKSSKRKSSKRSVGVTFSDDGPTSPVPTKKAIPQRMQVTPANQVGKFRPSIGTDPGHRGSLRKLMLKRQLELQRAHAIEAANAQSSPDIVAAQPPAQSPQIDKGIDQRSPAIKSPVNKKPSKKVKVMSPDPLSMKKLFKEPKAVASPKLSPAPLKRLFAERGKSKLTQPDVLSPVSMKRIFGVKRHPESSTSVEPDHVAMLRLFNEETSKNKTQAKTTEAVVSPLPLQRLFAERKAKNAGPILSPVPMQQLFSEQQNKKNVLIATPDVVPDRGNAQHLSKEGAANPNIAEQISSPVQKQRLSSERRPKNKAPAVDIVSPNALKRIFAVKKSKTQSTDVLAEPKISELFDEVEVQQPVANEVVSQTILPDSHDIQEQDSGALENMSLVRLKKARFADPILQPTPEHVAALRMETEAVRNSPRRKVAKKMEPEVEPAVTVAVVAEPAPVEQVAEPSVGRSRRQRVKVTTSQAVIEEPTAPVIVDEPQPTRRRGGRNAAKVNEAKHEEPVQSDIQTESASTSKRGRKKKVAEETLAEPIEAIEPVESAPAKTTRRGRGKAAVEVVEAIVENPVEPEVEKKPKRGRAAKTAVEKKEDEPSTVPEEPSSSKRSRRGKETQQFAVASSSVGELASNAKSRKSTIRVTRAMAKSVDDIKSVGTDEPVLEKKRSRTAAKK